MIPPMYELHAKMARIRYYLTDEEKLYFDWWFNETFGFPYGHSAEPLPPHLQEVFPKHKQPSWYTEEQIPGN